MIEAMIGIMIEACGFNSSGLDLLRKKGGRLHADMVLLGPGVRAESQAAPRPTSHILHLTPYTLHPTP